MQQLLNIKADQKTKDSNKHMSVKQFNGNYIKSEDRLMFRFNTNDGTEYRLWLTRFISLNLLDIIRRSIHQKLEEKHTPQIAQVIQEFQEDSVKKSTNFSAPYQPAKNVPLGSDPVLVHGFNLGQKEGQFSLAFQLANNKTLNLNLPAPALQSLAVLIEKLLDKAHWQIHPRNIEVAAKNEGTGASDILMH